MSRRKPYKSLHQSAERQLKNGRKPVWRSLDEKNMSQAERNRRAESEKPGGFLKGDHQNDVSLIQIGKKPQSQMSAEKLDTLNELLKSQPVVSRRGFLGASAAGTALTMAGCARRPVENIVPFVEGPEYVIPGIPTHFATVTQRGDDALGLVVTSYGGRPTKVEGNSQQPASLGATDMRAQLATWDLYDPDRSKSPMARGENGLAESTFDELDAALDALIESHTENRGEGLHILTRYANSPSVRRIRALLQSEMPNASFYEYDSVTDVNVRKGAELAFGAPVLPIYRLDAAKTLLSIDCDFLETETGSVRHTRGFASRRRITNPETQEMNRLYVAEATFSVTGANADHRFRMSSAKAGLFLQAIAAEIGVEGVTDPGGFDAQQVAAVAEDLRESDGRSSGVVLVGRRQPPHVHALAHAVNEAIGALGIAVAIQDAQEEPDSELTVGTIQDLAAADNIETLLILDGNPVYDAPADLEFGGILERDGVTSIHLSNHVDETSRMCSWHIPMALELEAWGDQRARNGLWSIQQPLIRPIWGGRSPLEILAKFAGVRNWRGYYVVRKTLRERFPQRLRFEQLWRESLHNGVVAGTMSRPERRDVQMSAVASALNEAPSASGEIGPNNFEVIFPADGRVWDGRYTNNLWALDAPDPLTKLVWDNAAIMSKSTMAELGVSEGDMLTIEKNGRSLEVPAYALPGHADFAITLHLGWGREHAGRYGSVKEWPGLAVERDWKAGGFDAQKIRTSDDFFFGDGFSVSAASGDYWLVTTQTHDSMEGRPIAIDATMAEYRAQPEFASYETVEMNIPPLWEQQDYGPQDAAHNRPLPQWGMVIDLSACAGCNACSVACTAENNVPSVGKQEIARGREMTWLRIDRYFIGDDENPQVATQPIGCQQCEEAPCENVCPVNATVHTPEGLNDMAYNRCIGTRYCANNCPYKVRRFNYLDWHAHLDNPWTMHGNFPEVRKMAFNPNVTVRMRGVMEKCSYCVQRIQAAKFKARREHRNLRDGDVVAACQQVCSAQAISFGDISNPNSAVSRANAVNRRYKLLAEVGTRPRTTFLAKIRNPNPALEGAASEEEAG